MALAGELDVDDDAPVAGQKQDVDPTALPDVAKTPSTLDKTALLRVAKSWIKADAAHSAKWRRLAKEWFAFRAGDQWTAEDRAILQDQERPVIVFNRVLTILKAVAGMEINGRHEITFLPRGNEDTAVAEELASTAKWMGQNCDAEDEESQAFDHTSTCGMGFVEERMGFLEQADGKYIEEVVSPLEMYWDRKVRKKNLTGASRMARIRRMPLSDAMRMFRGKTIEQLDGAWALEGAIDEATKTIDEKRKRDADSADSPDYIWDDGIEVTIVHLQWREIEDYWIVADPQEGTKVEMTDKEYRQLQKNWKRAWELIGVPAQPIDAARLQRYAYKQVFIGNEILTNVESTPIKDQFSWKCITGEMDEADGTWFGLVKMLRDPQMWANKWLSQILHILNTSAKGGILAELDAFENQADAEQTYAKPESITWMKAGALSGNKKPKIMPKPSQTMTDGYLGLLTFAISSFKDVSGINLELLGQQDQNQPGILEAMRKQAGMTVLATLFDSLRSFRKQIGRSRLFFTQNYLADGRIIRITNGDGQRVPLQLMKDRMTGEYDVVVDDTPTSPNQKEANWAIIQPLIAVFKEQLMAQPEVLAVLLEYSPLPSRIVEAVKKIISDAQNNPEAQAKQKLIEGLQVRQQLATIGKDESTAELNRAKAGTAQSTMAYEMSMAQNLISDNKWREATQSFENMAAMAKAEEAKAKASATQASAEREHAAFQTDQVRSDQQLALEHARTQQDMTHKAEEHGQRKIGMLVDIMAAHGKKTRDEAAAEKDFALADRARREPFTAPASQGA